MYSKDSDIEVAVLDYDEKSLKNFMNLVLEDSNYTQSLTFHRGDPPRIKFLANEQENGKRFIIRIKSQ